MPGLMKHDNTAGAISCYRGEMITGTLAIIQCACGMIQWRDDNGAAYNPATGQFFPKRIRDGKCGGFSVAVYTGPGSCYQIDVVRGITRRC